MIRRYDQPPLPPRVWCKLDKKVYSVIYIDFARKLYEVADNDKTYRLISFRDAILMQPIYAKDRNGIEIYELDTNGKVVVVYNSKWGTYGLCDKFFIEVRGNLEAFNKKGHIFMPEFKDLYDVVKEELGI